MKKENKNPSSGRKEIGNYVISKSASIQPKPSARAPSARSNSASISPPMRRSPSNYWARIKSTKILTILNGCYEKFTFSK